MQINIQIWKLFSTFCFSSDEILSVYIQSIIFVLNNQFVFLLIAESGSCIIYFAIAIDR